MTYNTDLEELETKIFNYFLSELELFIMDDNYDSAEEAIDSFCESDILNSSFRRSYYVDDFFEPELGISLKLLLSILRENNTTFKDYIRSILMNHNIEEELAKDGFKFKESKMEHIGNLLRVNEGIFEGIENSKTEVSDEDIKKVKGSLIKKSLGVEDLNTDDLDNDELDTILAKVSTINEKVDTIIKKMCGCGDEVIARAIAKYTGMHIKEAEEIVADMHD